MKKIKYFLIPLILIFYLFLPAQIQMIQIKMNTGLAQCIRRCIRMGPEPVQFAEWI
jgi:hypothetical protein